MTHNYVLSSFRKTMQSDPVDMKKEKKKAFNGYL